MQKERQRFQAEVDRLTSDLSSGSSTAQVAPSKCVEALALQQGLSNLLSQSRPQLDADEVMYDQGTAEILRNVAQLSRDLQSYASLDFKP
eukprot:TRINITY_DN26292_c0_g1_i1.p1 TRINITY_DN26292_c0_g1~~TRINITY_DN26292_c0_g1_i1.p1  ORF type:complete len:101 (-),score=20.19 TRINITY_DN26292_c0_g1_i1:62-331(-)